MYHLKIFAHGKWESAMGTFTVPANAYLRFFAAHGGVSLASETSNFESMDMAAAASGKTADTHLSSLMGASGANIVGSKTYRKLSYSPGDTVADYKLTHLGRYDALKNNAGLKLNEVTGNFMVIPASSSRQLSDAVQGAIACARSDTPVVIYCFFCRESADTLPDDAS